MTMSPPPRNSTDNDLGTAPTPAAGEALDFGLVSALVAALAISYGLFAWAKLTSLFAVVSIISVDMVVVFLVVPHAIAYWLGHDIDSLLRENTLDAK